MKSRILKKQWKKMGLLEAFFDDEVAPTDINKAMFIWELNPINSRKRLTRTAREYKQLRRYMKKIKTRRDMKAIKGIIDFSNKWEYLFELMLYTHKKTPNFMRYSQYKCYIPQGNTTISDEGIKVVNVDHKTGKVVKSNNSVDGLSDDEMKQMVLKQLKELEAGASELCQNDGQQIVPTATTKSPSLKLEKP
jgi:hypothetical protein